MGPQGGWGVQTELPMCAASLPGVRRENPWALSLPVRLVSGGLEV